MLNKRRLIISICRTEWLRLFFIKVYRVGNINGLALDYYLHILSTTWFIIFYTGRPWYNISAFVSCSFNFFIKAGELSHTSFLICSSLSWYRSSSWARAYTASLSRTFEPYTLLSWFQWSITKNICVLDRHPFLSTTMRLKLV